MYQPLRSVWFHTHGFGIRGSDGVIVVVKDDRFVGKAYNHKGMYMLNLKNHEDNSDSDSDESVNDMFEESIGNNAMAVGEDLSGSDESFESTLSSVSDKFVFTVDAFEFENGVIIGNINAIYFYYTVCSISLWHKRLAHTNIKNIEKMQKRMV